MSLLDPLFDRRLERFAGAQQDERFKQFVKLLSRRRHGQTTALYDHVESQRAACEREREQAGEASYLAVPFVFPGRVDLRTEKVQVLVRAVSTAQHGREQEWTTDLTGPERRQAHRILLTSSEPVLLVTSNGLLVSFQAAAQDWHRVGLEEFSLSVAVLLFGS